MPATRLRAKGQLTLPADIRAAARLEEGDPIEVELVAEGILLRPQKVVDSTQAWFWEPSWQAGEREASQQIAAEDTVTYDSGAAMTRALASRPAKRGKRRARDANV